MCAPTIGSAAKKAIAKPKRMRQRKPKLPVRQCEEGVWRVLKRYLQATHESEVADSALIGETLQAMTERIQCYPQHEYYATPPTLAVEAGPSPSPGQGTALGVLETQSFADGHAQLYQLEYVKEESSIGSSSDEESMDGGESEHDGSSKVPAEVCEALLGLGLGQNSSSGQSEPLDSYVYDAQSLSSGATFPVDGGDRHSLPTRGKERNWRSLRALYKESMDSSRFNVVPFEVASALVGVFRGSLIAYNESWPRLCNRKAPPEVLETELPPALLKSKRRQRAKGKSAIISATGQSPIHTPKAGSKARELALGHTMPLHRVGEAQPLSTVA